MTLSKHLYLISHRRSQLFIGWFHSRPGRPHFDTSTVGRASLLFLEKVGQKWKLITVVTRRKVLQIGWLE